MSELSWLSDEQWERIEPLLLFASAASNVLMIDA